MTTFVLVHGSFHGAWCWDRLVPVLEARGHTVVVPELPASGNDPAPIAEATLDAYVERIASVVEAQAELPLLVGHSMGAIVSAQVAERCAGRLAGVVFVCGLLLRSGETLVGFLDEFAHLGIEDRVLKNMTLSEDRSIATFPASAAREVFYHRCSEDDAAWAAARLRPQATAVYAQPTALTAERFGRVRCFYVAGRDDRAVPLALQRLMVQRTPCELVFELDTDHAPFLSAPRELAWILFDVARMLAPLH
jgi:pimeloyl-ACP methyl ester carboxylesterase